jgi:hypothetical protein
MSPSAGRRFLPSLAVAAVLAALLALPSAGSAQDAVTTDAACLPGNPYPGDDAPTAEIADWMATGSIEAGLPGELPVMAALVESEMQNLPGGDSDSVGYFQMRTSIWNKGAYAGYPTNPPLQLQWFTDQATKVRDQRIAAGRPDPALDDRGWGDWIADVERPRQDLRGRYQLRLEEARTLIGDPCSVTDDDPPELTLKGRQEQRASHSVAVSVLCDEDCDAIAKGFLKMEGEDRLRLESARGDYSPGDEKLKLELPVPIDALKAARRTLRKGGAVKAKLRVAVTDEAGNQVVGKRAVGLTS